MGFLKESVDSRDDDVFTKMDQVYKEVSGLVILYNKIMILLQTLLTGLFLDLFIEFLILKHIVYVGFLAFFLYPFYAAILLVCLIIGISRQIVRRNNQSLTQGELYYTFVILGLSLFLGGQIYGYLHSWW